MRRALLGGCQGLEWRQFCNHAIKKADCCSIAKAHRNDLREIKRFPIAALGASFLWASMEAAQLFHTFQPALRPLSKLYTVNIGT